MQHFEKLLSPSEYDRQLEPNCPIDFETTKNGFSSQISKTVSVAKKCDDIWK